MHGRPGASPTRPPHLPKPPDVIPMGSAPENLPVHQGSQRLRDPPHSVEPLTAAESGTRSLRGRAVARRQTRRGSK